MIALLVFLKVATVATVPSPRPAGWVTDQAAVLDAAAEAKLNATAEALKQTKNIELAVVTVDDVDGTPKQLATALFNHWGIGDAQTHTGVLVLLVMGQRRLEIETGTGIELALPAAWLADLQARTMVPRFKRGDFGGGLVAGVDAIAAHLAAAPGETTTTQEPGAYRSDGTIVQPSAPRTPVTPAPAPAHAGPPSDDDGGPSSGALVGGGAGLLGAGGATAALLARRRRRQRTCVACQPARRMHALSEIEDDTHLAAGERKEEQLGSVDYEVLVCRGCQQSRTLRHNKWFSGYSACSGCGFKTMMSSSATLVAATYDHGGEIEVTERCRHCAHTVSYRRYTSRLTPPSTTSSSTSSSSGSSSRSSSGFGGGSSRGGGAGSSW